MPSPATAGVPAALRRTATRTAPRAGSGQATGGRIDGTVLRVLSASAPPPMQPASASDELRTPHATDPTRSPIRRELDDEAVQGVGGLFKRAENESLSEEALEGVGPLFKRADREANSHEDSDNVEAVGPLFDEAEADALIARYQTMDPAMAKFAKRTGGNRDGLHDPTSPSMALSLPRTAEGGLSLEAINLMLQIQAKQAQDVIDQSSQARLTNLPTTKKGRADLKKRLKNFDPNQATGKTRLPELQGYKNGGKDVVSKITSGGVNMNVFHNEKDRNFRPRLGMFESAIKKITAAGFTFPVDLDVHLPKLGRSIDASTLCAIGETPRAVFNPPNFIHLSPAVVGNPIDTTLIAEDGSDVYKNLSTTLDPKKGVATVIHECGHLMHYHASPSRFFGLQGASFTREGSDIAAKVSGYASGHPREFVAEVFLGLIYGRNWDDDILEMYEAYGGPLTPEISTRIAKAKGGKGKKKG